MPKPATALRKYGKQRKKTRAELLWEELPKSSAVAKGSPETEVADTVNKIAEQLLSVTLEDSGGPEQSPLKTRVDREETGEVAQAKKEPEPSVLREDALRKNARLSRTLPTRQSLPKKTGSRRQTGTSRKINTARQPGSDSDPAPEARPEPKSEQGTEPTLPPRPNPEHAQEPELEAEVAAQPVPAQELAPAPEPEDLLSDLRVLTWDDVCPSDAQITKIAEASYAEVYRVTNALGTSIIKAVRLPSPLGPAAPAQTRAGFIDETPHAPTDLRGEMRVAEWLADVPGFVVYKERYVVRGKAPRPLLETHRAFHKRARRREPDRIQFYPSPGRYLDATAFLVVELGDAGVALEDFELTSAAQLWDIFLHTAVALARAEDLIQFEHRDLHEGNLCIRQVRAPKQPPSSSSADCHFGSSGLDITILDYGLSRASDPSHDPCDPNTVVAFDLEKDLSLFTSTHAPQCAIYRRMRAFLVSGDRHPPPPEPDQEPDYYAQPYPPCAPDGKPLSWSGPEHRPYTNVLWLAYVYEYLVRHFRGERDEIARFRRATREMWIHLNPDAPRRVLSFPSAADVVRFAVESGWVTEEQLVGGGSGGGGGERSWLAGGMDADEMEAVGNGSIIIGAAEARERERKREEEEEEEEEERRERGLRRSPRKSTRGGSCYT